MVKVDLFRKYISIFVGFFLVALLLTATPAQASSEDLTITKVAATATASESFPFTVTKTAGTSPANIFPNGTPSVAFNLNSANNFTKTFTGFQNATTGVVTSPNNYTITESTPTGWNPPTIVCQVTNSNLVISFNYSVVGSVSFEYTPNAMSPGAHILCTFTNTRVPVLTLQTTVSALTIPTGTAGFDSAVLVGASGATTGSLTYNLFAGTCPAQASNNPIFTSTVTVSGGTVPNSLPYTFNTAGQYYWVAVFTPTSGSPIVTGPCEPLTVTPVQTGTLTIIKDAQPNDAQDFQFISTGSGLSNFSLDDDLGAIGANNTLSNQITFSNLAVGVPYTVTENLVSGWTTPSIQCIPLPIGNSTTFTDQANRTFTVNIAAGAHITCTITNVKTVVVKTTATLIVIKRLLPISGNLNKFNLIIGPAGALGSGVTPNVGHLGTTGPVTITAGQNYNISESAGTGGTNLSQYTTTFTGACSPTGIVNLSTGSSGVCTITNTKKARLKVIKQLISSSNSDLFNLLIDLIPYANNVGNNGTTGVVLVDATLTHSVGETAGTGTNLSNFTTIYSPANCAGFFTIPPGGSKTCTIINRKK